METTSEHEELVQWLGTPQAYMHRPQLVEHLQTHISHVFLAGRLVYKLKKPVKYDFLDFSTLANRQHACREELRLNRRLAGDMYLRVMRAIRGDDGRFALADADDVDTSGRIVDWLVEMRRLPTELTLEALHRRGELRGEHIARLADTLVRFYRTLPPLRLEPEQYREDYVQHVGANRRALLAEKRHLPRSSAQRVHGFQLQLLQLCPKLFRQRVDSGFIVDGHGDLRPEHICLSDPIAIFDCIEFNAALRRIDEADELAFLAEECDCLGTRWVGAALIAAYKSVSGDAPPPILFDFYKSYRACVRAKVAALRGDQLVGQAQQQADDEAGKRLALADQYVEPWLRPLVLIVGGLSGTGKTTLATALATVLGAELLRTDVVRRELYGSGPHGVSADSGIYLPEARRRVYAQLIQRFGALHREGISVVLDGTFSRLDILRGVQAEIEHPQAIVRAIQCVCRKEVAQQRIAARLAEGEDASDAHPELHDIQQLQWEAWPTDLPQIRIDTEQSLETQVEQVLRALRREYCG